MTEDDKGSASAASESTSGQKVQSKSGWTSLSKTGAKGSSYFSASSPTIQAKLPEVKTLCQHLITVCVAKGKEALDASVAAAAMVTDPAAVDSQIDSAQISAMGSVDLCEDDVSTVIVAATAVVLAQPSLLYLRAPLRIVGDIHGQFVDLIRIFERCGYPPQQNYLFLGDYVDRGKHGLECASLLLAFKVLYPESIFLLRGNHECAAINRVYGFFAEVKNRFSAKLWRTFCELFDSLPLAAVVGDRIFCIHGGLSPALRSLDEITSLERPLEVPGKGMICDFLWSDPDHDIEGWAESDRGVSFTFGADVVNDFLDTNDFDLMVRAHQVVEDGYEFFAGRRLVTLFSAPNYCNEFDNAGAVMVIDEELQISFQILKPLSLPGGENFDYIGRPATPGVGA